MLSAVQTGNEDRHRLICGARLHLIVSALPLMTLLAEEYISGHGAVTLQLPLLAHVELFKLRLPPRSAELILIHRSKILDLYFTRLVLIK